MPQSVECIECIFAMVPTWGSDCTGDGSEEEEGGCYQRGVPVEEEEEGGRLTVCFNNRLSAGETSRHLSGPHYTPLYPPATDAHGCNSYTFQLENCIVTEI